MIGRKRVIIANVNPGVDKGQYPAKAIVNRPITISADIFTDGHDTVAAAALIKFKNEKQWKELELIPVGNDRWEAVFTPVQMGTYQFQVQGWVDHFTTWQQGFEKKYKAGQDMTAELKAGQQIVADVANTLAGKNKEPLQSWINKIAAGGSIEEQAATALDNSIGATLNKYRNKNRVTTYPVVFELTADRERAAFSSWYELFPRSAAATPGVHGTFNDVMALLPRLSKMGFDVLYLPPIHPIGITHRKGKNNSLQAAASDPGSPWAIGSKEGGHKAIHPQLGTLKDFKKLIAESKKHGLELAMDIAFQCSPDHPYLTKHPEWFKWRADGTVQFAENPPKKYEDIVPFDFESDAWKELWEELKSVIEYWIGQGVDIFRVDNPHTKAIPFWEWVIAEIKAEHPQVLFLAEAFTRPRIMEQLAKIGFSQSYTYFTWRNTKAELEEYITELTKTDLKYYFRPNFWPNTPDILMPELVWGKENQHIVRLILAATLSSSYGIYGPVYEQNIADPVPGKEEYTNSEKYEIKNWDWGKYTKTSEVIHRVNKIRKEHTALQDTNNIELVPTDNDQVICYIKKDKETADTVIVVVNLDVFNTQSASVNLPATVLDKQPDETFFVNDLLTGDKYEWHTGWNYVSLNPFDMPAHIFSIQNHTK